MKSDIQKTEYTRGEKQLKRVLEKCVLCFGVLFTCLGVLIFGAGELITVYFSNLHGFDGGIIIAQILSILGDVLTFVCLVLFYASMGACQMAYGTSRSKRTFLIGFLSPVLTSLASFLVFYVLVLLGWHDYTLRMFFDYAPLFIYESGFAAIVSELVTVFVIVAFYLAGALRDGFSEDPVYNKTVKIVFYVLIIIKVISLGTDIALYDGGYSSINNVLSGIVFPILYEVLEIGAGFFALKKFKEYISAKATSLGVQLKVKR